MENDSATTPVVTCVSYEDLSNLPIGVEALLWGTQGQRARVLSYGYGETFVENLEPFLRSVWHRFFVWSSGGGHSLGGRDTSLADAWLLWEKSQAQARAFWHGVVSDRERLIISNGHAYNDGGPVKPGYQGFVGFGGRQFVLQRLSDGHVLITNNLWHRGKVPDEYGLSDTHRVLQTYTTAQPQPNAASAEQERIIKS